MSPRVFDNLADCSHRLHVRVRGEFISELVLDEKNLMSSLESQLDAHLFFTYLDERPTWCVHGSMTRLGDFREAS